MKLGRLEIKTLAKSKNSLWGRFGGGWNWKLGFQAGGNTLIISLLVIDVRFCLKDHKEAAK